jgi:transposase
MIQKRLHAVYLKGSLNYSNRMIGLITGLHPNIVAHWIAVFQKQGLAALKTNSYGKGKSDLEAYAPAILSEFEAAPPRSAAEAAERIGEQTGIHRSPQQIRVFMKRHGLRFRKCGHIPAKADPARQQQWVETELNPAIDAATDGRIHLLFCDAADNN